MTIKASGGLCPFCKHRPDIRPQLMPSSQNLKNSLPHGRRPYKHRRAVPRSGTTTIGARPVAAPAPPCGAKKKRPHLSTQHKHETSTTPTRHAKRDDGGTIPVCRFLAAARTMTSALHTSQLTSLPLLARGKVRDNYAVGQDRILMVASDRISAFDVIMGEPIPGKGALLTKMALFWFELLKDVAPNHLTGDDPVSVVKPEERAQVEGRAMLVKKLKPLPVEAVVRGYLAGSGWKEYQHNGEVCG